MKVPHRVPLIVLVCATLFVFYPALSQVAPPGVWTNSGPYGGRVCTLAIDPTTPSTLYAGTYGGGAFKSTNAGGSWAAVSTGQS